MKLALKSKEGWPLLGLFFAFEVLLDIALKANDALSLFLEDIDISDHLIVVVMRWLGLYLFFSNASLSFSGVKTFVTNVWNFHQAVNRGANGQFVRRRPLSPF